MSIKYLLEDKKMTLDELKDYYGSGAKAASQLGLTRCAFYIWKKTGHIPLHHQFKFEKLTNGKLKADVNDTNYKK